MQQLSQQKRYGRHGRWHGNHHQKEEMDSVVTASGRIRAHQALDDDDEDDGDDD